MSVLSARTATFGDQLQSWAHGLEADCGQLKASLDRTQPRGGCGGLLLRTMDGEIAAIGAELAQAQGAAFGDGSLSSMLAAAMQFQADSEAQLVEAEAQLARAGAYTPLGGHAEDEAAAADAAPDAEDEEDEEDEEENDETASPPAYAEPASPMDPLAAADAMEPEPDSPAQEWLSHAARMDAPSTPTGKAEPELDVMRTPTLEGFGLNLAKYGLDVPEANDEAEESPAAATVSPAFVPRQSPRLQASARKQSPMEKVLARASLPSPLQSKNATAMNRLT